MHVVAGALIALLVLFSLRRLVWVAAAWRRPRAPAPIGEAPEVLLAVAFRNERESLPDLLRHLAALDYDSHRLSFCLVDDGSTDGCGNFARAWVRDRPNARLVVLDSNVGKAASLDRALALAAPSVDVLVVYDADQRPHRDSLRRLVAPFADSRVAATCGYRRPRIATPNAIAMYACVEAWTHQLVNLAAKDALDLDPPTMGGNCAYRRAALVRVGGFPAGAFCEDVEVSLALAANGGATRFVRGAIADHHVADSFAHFVNQRLRWSKGLFAARRRARGPEAALVAAGYLDRVVLLLVAACIAAGCADARWMLAYALPALAAVATAIVKASPPPRIVLATCAALPLMFVVDVIVSAAAVGISVARRRVRWLDRHSAGSSGGRAHRGAAPGTPSQMGPPA